MKMNIFKGNDQRNDQRNDQIQRPRQNTTFNNNNKEIANRFMILEDDVVVKPNDFVRENHRYTEQRRYNERGEGNNRFIDEKAREKKRKENGLVMSDNNFPVISDNINNKSVNVTTNSNYASMVKKEKIKESAEIEEKVPMGWVRLEFKGRKIVYNYGEKSQDSDNELSLHESMSAAVDQMIRRWEKYREDYIDLYGLDNYEKYYTSKTEYISDDDEEED